jgi:hypothetical protein
MANYTLIYGYKTRYIDRLLGKTIKKSSETPDKCIGISSMWDLLLGLAGCLESLIMWAVISFQLSIYLKTHLLLLCNSKHPVCSLFAQNAQLNFLFRVCRQLSLFLRLMVN